MTEFVSGTLTFFAVYGTLNFAESSPAPSTMAKPQGQVHC